MLSVQDYTLRPRQGNKIRRRDCNTLNIILLYYCFYMNQTGNTHYILLNLVHVVPNVIELLPTWHRLQYFHL